MKSNSGGVPQQSAIDALLTITSTPRWLRPRPVVVDAHILISDVLRWARDGWTMLTALAQMRAIVLVTPSHIEDKVLEHLPRVAESVANPIDADVVMEVWDSIYCELVRFVELPGWTLDAQYTTAVAWLADVAQADPEDAPAIYLAALLDSSILLSRDHDHTDYGYGADDWLAVLVLLGELAQEEEVLLTIAQAVGVSVGLPPAALFVGARLLWQRSPLMLGFLCGLLTGACIFARPRLRACAKKLGAAAGSAASAVGEITAPSAQKRNELQAALDKHIVVTGANGLADAAAVARVLVGHAGPVPSHEVHTLIAARGSTLSLTGTRQLLRNHPAFAGMPGRGYSLGRPAK
jgi:predicted nucleic acid-binding protein